MGSPRRRKRDGEGDANELHQKWQGVDVHNEVDYDRNGDDAANYRAKQLGSTACSVSDRLSRKRDRTPDEPVDRLLQRSAVPKIEDTGCVDDRGRVEQHAAEEQQELKLDERAPDIGERPDEEARVSHQQERERHE